MAGKLSPCKKEEREMENVCRLHKPEQGVSKGLIPSPPNRPSRFLDAYSGYHQIAMSAEDQLATSFITPFGAFCYSSMLFGLKNAGATFQRCMRRVFGDLIG